MLLCLWRAWVRSLLTATLATSSTTLPGQALKRRPQSTAASRGPRLQPCLDLGPRRWPGACVCTPASVPTSLPGPAGDWNFVHPFLMAFISTLNLEFSLRGLQGIKTPSTSPLIANVPWKVPGRLLQGCCV